MTAHTIHAQGVQCIACAEQDRPARTTRTRTKTRGSIPLESLIQLIDRVGVAREQVRGLIDPRFGGRLAHIEVTADQLAIARSELASVQQKLDMALETLRAMRYDA